MPSSSTALPIFRAIWKWKQRKPQKQPGRLIWCWPNGAEHECWWKRCWIQINHWRNDSKECVSIQYFITVITTVWRCEWRPTAFYWAMNKVLPINRDSTSSCCSWDFLSGKVGVTVDGPLNERQFWCLLACSDTYSPPFMFSRILNFEFLSGIWNLS